MALSGKDKLLYGTGAFGYGSVNQMLGNYLMFFGTGVLGLSGTLMGLAVGISTAWDAVTDPLVGALSDNLRSRFGKRHLLMIIGCLLVAALNLAVWHINPAWSETTKFLVLLLILLLIETFNTVYSTPYAALGLDMAQTYHERTSIQNYKTAFQAASLMVPSLLMMLVLNPQDYVTINTTTRGYQIIALITSVLCIATGWLAVFGTRRYRVSGVTAAVMTPVARTPLMVAFFSILKNRNNRYLIAAYAVALACGAFITSLGMHIFTYTFHFSSLQIPVIMACLVIGIIGSQPLWYKLSECCGKKDTVLMALAVVLVGAVIFAFILAFRLFLARSVLLILVAGVILVISAGVGCIYSLPISMFADNVTATNTALATGFLTFCTKLANACVTLLVGVILDLIGFQSGAAGQSLTTCTALGWSLIIGVVLAAVAAWWLFSKYQDQKTPAYVTLKA